MEESKNGKAALIASIEKDAQSEADAILAEARKLADEQKAYGEKQAQAILKKADEKAAEQSKAAKKKILSGIDVEVKRRIMHAQDSLLKTILNRVEEKLYARIKNKQYRKTLLNWVIEAAIGLDANAAGISAPKDELAYIDKAFLSEAEKKVKSYTGRPVALSLSDNPQKRMQGIILTAEDGRTAFNNQVRTRIVRNEREIRKRIYDTLFAEE